MAENIFKVSLPGDLFQKNNRWWWKVKLPGERRIKARGLKPRGDRFATTERDKAEQVARQMWESAIRAEVRAEARAKAREKAKAHKQEMAGVKAEAGQTVARMKTEILKIVARAKAECEEKLRGCNEMVAEAEERVRAEAEKRADAEAKLNELLAGAAKTATCDCCGRQDIPEGQMTRIDSGQMLCADCLEAMRG